MRTIQALKTVVPIVGVSADGTPLPVGSGVLLGYGGARWLVSAAHVLDEAAQTTLYLPGTSGLVALEGDFMKTKPPSSGRDDDPMDLGFVEIGGVADSISNDHQFLPEHLVSLGGESEEGRNYLFLGYPHKAVKVRKDLKKIRTQPHSYEAKGIGLDRYQMIGLSPKTHVAITFDAKRAKNGDGQIEVPKDQRGTSGGGVWIGDPNFDGSSILKPMLVGIIIEHRRSEKLLVATRILPLLEHLKK